MEAIFAKSIDLRYVSPGPALNPYTKSHGVGDPPHRRRSERRSAALVVQPDQKLKAAADFRGKKDHDAPLGSTVGYFLPRVAHQRRFENLATGRRCAGNPDAKPGSIVAIQAKNP